MVNSQSSLKVEQAEIAEAFRHTKVYRIEAPSRKIIEDCVQSLEA